VNLFYRLQVSLAKIQTYFYVCKREHTDYKYIIKLFRLQKFKLVFMFAGQKETKTNMTKTKQSKS